MSHGHSHLHPIRIHSHEEKNRRVYRNYCYLFIVSFVSAIGEFLIALLLAHSVSAQADAIHSMVHVSLYGIALWISKNILYKKMNEHEASHYREKFITLFAIIVFSSLGLVLYNSIARLLSSEAIVSEYMLLSVAVGLSGNMIALKILNTITKIQGGAASKNTTHNLLSLDTWGDFAISILVLFTAVVALVPIWLLDFLISLGAVAWIGVSGLRILKKKTFNHSH